MNLAGKVKVNMKPVNQILREKGLTAGGDVQRFHTGNVMRRISKYMPYRSGMLIKGMITSSDLNTMIVIPGPYARFLYYGKLMVDPVTGAAGFMDKDGQWKSRKDVAKVLSDRPISYDKGKNELAGPFWDRNLIANEQPAMQAELQAYVNGKADK